MDNDARILMMEYLDPEQGDKAAAEFDKVLQADPVLVKEFAGLLMISSQLSELGQAASVPVHNLPRRAVHKLKKEDKRTSFRPALIGLAACLLLAVGLWMFMSKPQPTQPEIIVLPSISRITEITGDAEIARDNETLPAVAGMDILEGDRITTAESGLCSFVFDQGQTVIQLGPESAMHISLKPAGKRLQLEAGNITADVAVQPIGTDLVVSTHDCRITVIGTRFELSTDKLQTTLVMHEGEVECVRIHDGLAVTVGQDFTISTAQTVFKPLSINPPVPPALPIHLEDILLKPVADARLKQSKKVTNLGSTPTLTARNSTTGFDSRSVIRFDLNGIDPAQITRATLRLYRDDDLDAGGTNTIDTRNTLTISRISDNWDEAEVTWYNAPKPGIVIAEAPLVPLNEWIEADVSDELSIQTDGAVSFFLSLKDTRYPWLDLSSREGSHSPELLLQFSQSGEKQ